MDADPFFRYHDILLSCNASLFSDHTYVLHSRAKLMNSFTFRKYRFQVPRPTHGSSDPSNKSRGSQKISRRYLPGCFNPKSFSSPVTFVSSSRPFLRRNTIPVSFLLSSQGVCQLCCFVSWILHHPHHTDNQVTNSVEDDIPFFPRLTLVDLLNEGLRF